MGVATGSATPFELVLQFTDVYGIGRLKKRLSKKTAFFLVNRAPHQLSVSPVIRNSGFISKLS